MSAGAENLKALYEAEGARLLTLSDGAGEYALPVFGEGDARAQLVLIGEAPGGDEAKQGRPFVGKAGKQLDALLAMAGIDREQVFVTNAVKFRPVNIKNGRFSNRTPSLAEVRQSLPVLEAELKLVRPLLIATLGNTPLKALCLLAGMRPITVGAAHGQIQDFIIGGTAVTVFPLYHPASVIYNPALLPELEKDIRRLGDVLRGMAQ